MRITAEHFSQRKENRITRAHTLSESQEVETKEGECDKCGAFSSRLLSGLYSSPRIGLYGRKAQLRRGFLCGRCLPKAHGPRCETCGRQTDWLFDGPMVPARALNPNHHDSCMCSGCMKALRAGLRPSHVCQRCRPPSNLDILESPKASRDRALPLRPRAKEARKRKQSGTVRSRSYTFVISGKAVTLSKQDVIERLRSVTPGVCREHVVEVSGLLHPLKGALAAVTGLDVLRFQTAQSFAVFQKLGFKVDRLSKLNGRRTAKQHHRERHSP